VYHPWGSVVPPASATATARQARLAYGKRGRRSRTGVRDGRRGCFRQEGRAGSGTRGWCGPGAFGGAAEGDGRIKGQGPTREIRGRALWRLELAECPGILESDQLLGVLHGPWDPDRAAAGRRNRHVRRLAGSTGHRSAPRRRVG